ncbi:hypothetical protein B0T20DRAFT_477562 [Sordaria brevicollis]|uniref:BTB domain-containing protein n=1 Tax=Sordaria brevicollis TaxID=83679 RepID=A0AAE0PGS7_SORBR|nr:hypothetical protein B0T20DRAFT_477562 [Sordaria brevicollis]
MSNRGTSQRPLPNPSATPSGNPSPAASPEWRDYLLNQCFYQTDQPVPFDAVPDTVLLVRGIWAGVGNPRERAFLINSHHLSSNSSYFRRLFSPSAVESISRAGHRRYMITLRSVDAEALYLILRVIASGRSTLPPTSLNDGFNRVCRIAETAYRLEFNIGAADPSDQTAALTIAARWWLWDITRTDAAPWVHHQRAELAKRLPDSIWLHLSGTLNCHGRACTCEEHRLTREEEPLANDLREFPTPLVRLILMFYNILIREAPFPPHHELRPPAYSLSPRRTQLWPDGWQAMWNARARLHNRTTCTCGWLPSYYATWTRLLEHHLNPFAEDARDDDDLESHQDFFTRTASLLASASNTVPKPWVSYPPGQEPLCTLANGREGHERKATELGRKLREALYQWLSDLERSPVSVFDSDCDFPWEVQGNELVPYEGGTTYHEEEDEDTPYPQQVYDLPPIPGDVPAEVPEEVELETGDCKDSTWVTFHGTTWTGMRNASGHWTAWAEKQ